MMNRYGLRQGDISKVESLAGEVYKTCAEILKMALSEITLRQKICNHQLHLVLQMLENDNCAIKAHDNIEDIVDGVCRFIEVNLDNLRDTEEIVRHSGYSREHLGRLFKKYRGVTTLRYLRQRQMLLARELLRNSGYTLGMIAEYFGFSDAYAFSKSYRKIMGRSPGKERS
jgi:transcriptional regulator GlxA family with amidase domain